MGAHMSTHLSQHGHQQFGGTMHHANGAQASHGGFGGGGGYEDGFGGLGGGASASSAMMLSADEVSGSSESMMLRGDLGGRYSHTQHTIQASMNLSGRSDFEMSTRSRPGSSLGTEREHGTVSGISGNSLFSDSNGHLGDGSLQDEDSSLLLDGDIHSMDAEDSMAGRNSDIFHARHKPSATFASGSAPPSNSTSQPNSGINSHYTSSQYHNNASHSVNGLSRPDPSGNSTIPSHLGYAPSTSSSTHLTYQHRYVPSTLPGTQTDAHFDFPASVSSSSHFGHNSSPLHLHLGGSRDLQTLNGYNNHLNNNSALTSSSYDVSSQSDASPGTTASYNSISESPVASNDGVVSPHSPALNSQSPGSVPNSALTYAPTQLPLAGHTHAGAQASSQFSPPSPAMVSSPNGALGLSSSASRARSYDSPSGAATTKATSAATGKKKTAAANSNSGASTATGGAQKTKKRGRAPSVSDAPSTSAAIANSSKITATQTAAYQSGSSAGSSAHADDAAVSPPPAKRQASKAPRNMSLHNSTNSSLPSTPLGTVSSPQAVGTSVSSPHPTTTIMPASPLHMVEGHFGLVSGSSISSVSHSATTSVTTTTVGAKKAGGGKGGRAVAKAGGSAQAPIPISPTSPIPSSSQSANNNSKSMAAAATANSNGFKIPPSLSHLKAMSPNGVFQPDEGFSPSNSTVTTPSNMPALGRASTALGAKDHGVATSTSPLGHPEYPPRAAPHSLPPGDAINAASGLNRSGNPLAKAQTSPEQTSHFKHENMASRAAGPHPSSPFMPSMSTYPSMGQSQSAQMPHNAGKGPNSPLVSFTPNRPMPVNTPPMSRNDSLTGNDEKERVMYGSSASGAQSRANSISSAAPASDPQAASSAITSAIHNLKAISHDINSIVGTLVDPTTLTSNSTSTSTSYHNVTTMQQLVKRLNDALMVCASTEPHLNQAHAHSVTISANSASLPLTVLPSSATPSSNSSSGANASQMPNRGLSSGSNTQMMQQQQHAVQQHQAQMAAAARQHNPGVNLASSASSLGSSGVHGYYSQVGNNHPSREQIMSQQQAHQQQQQSHQAQQNQHQQHPMQQHHHQQQSSSISAGTPSPFYNGPPRVAYQSPQALSSSASSSNATTSSASASSGSSNGSIGSMPLSASSPSLHNLNPTGNNNWNAQQGIFPTTASGNASSANGGNNNSNGGNAAQARGMSSPGFFNNHPGAVGAHSGGSHASQSSTMGAGQSNPGYGLPPSHLPPHHSQGQLGNNHPHAMQHSMQQSSMSAGNPTQHMMTSSQQQHGSMHAHPHQGMQGMNSAQNMQHMPQGMHAMHPSQMAPPHARQGAHSYVDRSMPSNYYNYPQSSAHTHSPNHQ